MFSASKKIVVKSFLIAIALLSSRADAQHVAPGVKLYHYLFNEFISGTVQMKSGETYSQVLNYNILTNEMIFNEDGKYLAIATPENVDTVYISNRKFIPLNNKFYEVLVNTNVPLLLEFTATISDPGASTGYGGTSTTTAATSIKSLVNSGGAYDLKLPDGFKVIPGFNYWILKNWKLEKAGSESQLIKIFPQKKEMIKDLVKKKNINFSKSDDIAKLIKQIE